MFSMNEKVDISDKEFIILGMLAQKPMYGYEIDKEIQETSMREWTDLAFSSIYYILNKLEKKELILSETVKNEKNQTKKIYTVTSVGKSITYSYLKSIFCEYSFPKWRIDIGLAYLSLLNQSEIRSALESYAQGILKMKSDYQKLKEYLISEKCPSNRIQLADRPLFILSAENDWIQQFQQTIINQE